MTLKGAIKILVFPMLAVAGWATIIVLVLMLTGCATPRGVAETDPDPEDVCYAPWADEPYRSGRAIPAPGPDGVLPLCDGGM